MSTIKTPVTVVATGVIEAIKSCEFRDADNKFLFVAYMSEQQANAIRDALNSNAELLEALGKLMGYIDDGTLVRDISKDAHGDWAIRMMRFLADLTQARAAIKKAGEV